MKIQDQHKIKPETQSCQTSVSSSYCKIPKEFFGEEETELIGIVKLASTKCKCIRYVGSIKWYPNGCKIHPNG